MRTASLFLLAMVACTATNTPPAGNAAAAGTDTLRAGADNSRNALDWSGRYEGTLPCTDCAGIQLSLLLNTDSTYVLITEFLGTSQPPFTRRGRFRWNESGSQIELLGLGEAPNRYRVGENELTQLDTQGQRILGAQAYRYVLQKVRGKSVTDSTDHLTQLTAPASWRLTDMFGAKIETTAVGSNIPALRFDRGAMRVSGTTGCNEYSGTFALRPGNRLRITDVVMTERACAGPNLESEFLQLLNTADSYDVNATTLTLHRARMAPLARFEAVAR